MSVSRHFLLQAPQCPCSVRKRFSRDHCYLLMAQDGHRCGHVVAFASVKNETAVYMRRIFDTLKLTNPEACSNIGVVITDRDFTEQQTVAAGLPHASLQVCIFHVLRAFNRERCFIFNSVAHTPQSAGMVGPSTVFRRRPYREKRRWHRSVALSLAYSGNCSAA